MQWERWVMIHIHSFVAGPIRTEGWMLRKDYFTDEFNLINIFFLLYLTSAHFFIFVMAPGAGSSKFSEIKKNKRGTGGTFELAKINESSLVYPSIKHSFTIHQYDICVVEVPNTEDATKRWKIVKGLFRSCGLYETTRTRYRTDGWTDGSKERTHRRTRSVIIYLFRLDCSFCSRVLFS